MRTTIRLSDRLLQEAKEKAFSEHISLNSFIIDSIQEKLRNHPPGKNHNKKYPVITFKGDGILPGVDLNDSTSLLELMETETN